MHDCCNCGGACYCHGDIDDCQVEDPGYAFEHCEGCGCEEDDYRDDDGTWDIDIDDELDDDVSDPDYEPRCHTCGGEGFVENVAAETGRWGWDEDGMGTCPNCRGSGLRKDCTTF